MLYVERNQNGLIVGIHKEPTAQANESISIMDNEVIEFLNSTGINESFKTIFNILDQNIIRVLDDLIELMVEKKIILFTDLPFEAQEKIKERKIVRQKINKNDFIVDDIL